MVESNISASDPYERKRVPVLDSEMAYIDVGSGDPVVFLHGNPTSSYLWRNIIPHLEAQARCLAPDLIGMGQSGRPGGEYRFVDHRRYLDAWFDAVGVTGSAVKSVTVVIHDWGSALGADWAMRHADQIKGVCYMEGIFREMAWSEFVGGELFQQFRTQGAGEDLILQNNVFVEQILGGVRGGLDKKTHDHYRAPYLEAGEGRRPTLTWPRELPIDGEPAETVAIVTTTGNWMASTDVPKLFINSQPGAIIQGAGEEFCRSFKNQTEVEVEGTHYVQEESPAAIGAALSDWYGKL
jgi:haloalkane dehalogenase